MRCRVAISVLMLLVVAGCAPGGDTKPEHGCEAFTSAVLLEHNNVIYDSEKDELLIDSVDAQYRIQGDSILCQQNPDAMRALEAERAMSRQHEMNAPNG